MMMRSSLPAALVCVAGLTLLTGPAHAAPKDEGSEAAPQKKSVALGQISGAKPKEVREWARVALAEEFELTDAEDFKPKNNDAAFAKMGKDLGVDFVIVGKLEKDRLVLTVRNGRTGKLVRDVEIEGARGPKLKQAIASDLAPAVAAAVGQKKAAPPEKEEKPEPPPEKPKDAKADEDLAEEAEGEEEPSEEPAESTEEPTEEAPAAEGSTGASAAPLIAAAGVRLYHRSFAFNDALEPELAVRPVRDYTLPLGPSVFLRVQLYPGALLGGEGFVTNVGLIGGFEQGIATTSTYTGPDMQVPGELKNELQEWYVGLRGRVPSATSELGFSLAYGRHQYVLGGDEAEPTVPDVSYSHFRVGGDGRLIFGNIFVGAQLAARLVTDVGDIGESYWFPNTGAVGVDVGLSGGYRLLDTLSLIAGIDYVRYGLDFTPLNPMTVPVAGGAVDQYISGWVGAEFQLPGSVGAAGEFSPSAE